MRYIGGKSKIAKQISDTILSVVNVRRDYLEPFIGGGSVFAKIAPHFEHPVAGDIHPDLCLMWDAVFNTPWQPPNELSQEDWELLRNAEPSPIRAFAGFGCSFGGKWFRGYARGGFTAAGSPRNHQGESSRAVIKIKNAVTNPVQVYCLDYRDWNPRPGTVIYCDPPYAQSTSWDAISDNAYGTECFNSEEFWLHAVRWADSGCYVFVSEYIAPPGWTEVWSGQKAVTLKKTTDSGGRQVMTERLFYRSQKKIR